jgi:hypothetical protein
MTPEQLLEAFWARLHTVRFRRSGTGITAYCDQCPDWRVHVENGHSIRDMVRLAAEHSGFTQ